MSTGTIRREGDEFVIRGPMEDVQMQRPEIQFDTRLRQAAR